jgi:hypothetical protein
MIRIVRNGGAVVFGVARARPGRANMLNCRCDGRIGVRGKPVYPMSSRGTRKVLRPSTVST